MFIGILIDILMLLLVHTLSMVTCMSITNLTPLHFATLEFASHRPRKGSAMCLWSVNNVEPDHKHVGSFAISHSPSQSVETRQ